MDQIQLRGLRVVGTHGVLREEQERAQPFEIDLDLDVDLRAAASSDALGDTVDYGAVVELVAGVVAGERCALLESLAERIASAVLASDSRVVGLAVTVRKLRPPVAADLQTAAVRLQR